MKTLYDRRERLSISVFPVVPSSPSIPHHQQKQESEHR